MVNHYNVQPLYDVYANVQDRDLGAVAADVQKVLAEFQPKLPKGSFIEMRGQVATMKSSFVGLGVGMIFAIVLVYFVMVVNFQSWLDPVHHPDGAAGRAVRHPADALRHPDHHQRAVADGRHHEHRRGHREQHPAGEFRQRHCARPAPTAIQAALEAGYTRLRPVMMTALAMIVGMLPMALGLGEGGEQNAPLGRAVIGGLLMATVATLFFVPGGLQHPAQEDAERLRPGRIRVGHAPRLIPPYR